jgi:catechol 2,3-dioxygenase-like lactoylglutathione lyase family enzyme
MEVKNIRWVGIPTEDYGAMRELLEQVMDGPGDPYFDFFRRHARGPVPLFEVDDVHAARVELDEKGIAIVGDLGRDSRWEWIHFRAPDGNLYELASRRADA